MTLPRRLVCPQVLESGTGSGSLTHSLARAVAPAGVVHTFEFHQQRWQEASAEFEANGLQDLVQCSHRNIEALGFPESLHGRADAVVLDLPGPWKVLVPPPPDCACSPTPERVAP
jgi:tRNA (adenine57-N1/adenine58-N1)-methyltransferase catalytic subunit